MSTTQSRTLVCCLSFAIIFGLLPACTAVGGMSVEEPAAQTEPAPTLVIPVAASATREPVPTPTVHRVASPTPVLASATPTELPASATPTELLASRTPRPTPTAVEGVVQVQVGEFFVDPSILTIVVGTTVEWVPVGERAHTIVSFDHNPGWPRDGSVGMMGSPAFRATFNEPGVYEYYCNVHPSVMDGKIIVVEAVE